MVVIAAAAALVTLILGVAAFIPVHKELERQLDHRIEIETRALLDLHAEEGFEALVQVVGLRERQGLPSDTGYLAEVGEAGRTMGYMVFDAAGRRRAGDFQAATPPPGWSEFVDFRRADGSAGVAHTLNSALPGGGRLVVAADRAVVMQMDMALLRLFLLEFGLILAVIIGAAVLLGRLVQRRLAAIEATAQAIMAGDLARRMPLDGSGGEFDRLSAILNAMLERIGALMANLRQVSSDIAHDLRTPLTRLRGGLEAAEAAAAGTPQAPALARAIAETDALLDLFSSLLAVSEIEGRSLQSRFVPVDVKALVAEMAEAYGPAMEGAGMSLELSLAPATVSGDVQLLRRCLANLLDNILAHTPPGTRIAIALERREGRVVLRVADDGPGVPAEERERIFERMVRLERDRGSPGHGLGLSLVAAIVGAHRGTVRAAPADKGLTIEIDLPASAAT